MRRMWSTHTRTIYKKICLCFPNTHRTCPKFENLEFSSFFNSASAAVTAPGESFASSVSAPPPCASVSAPPPCASAWPPPSCASASLRVTASSAAFASLFGRHRLFRVAPRHWLSVTASSACLCVSACTSPPPPRHSI